MRFSTVFVVAASAAVASAASLTERGFFHHFKPHKPVYHTIVVGDAKGDTIYTPPVVYANEGDFVTFQFEQKNHSATQSRSFFEPCTDKRGGFDSGFFPVGPDVKSGFPTFTIEVKNKEPIFFHCNQGANTAASHCGKGMVGIINPQFGGEFGIFQKIALEIGKKLGASK